MWQNLKNKYHLLVALLANLAYGFPAKKLKVIGVTGTDGKTTTVNLIYHLLKSIGKNVSMISTVGAVIHSKKSDLGFHVTNPDSLSLQKFIRQAVNLKDEYLILEVTSHGIDQNRIWGIPIELAVLTNISHEHLDYHKTYDNYVRTKVKFLNKANKVIINKSDPSFKFVKNYLTNKNLYTFGQLNSQTSISDIIIPKHFLGKYNMQNALAAASVAINLGISEKSINKALKTFVFPQGRSEIVYSDGFSVMIDFAHTPNSFEQLLSSLRQEIKGRIIHVFGSAGERDRSKRPLMGKIASI